MKIRIYSPEDPSARREGAHVVIAEQIDYLKSIGHSVEVISWKKPETVLGRLSRIVFSFFSPYSSTELAYYLQRLSLDDAAEIDLAIYHYSFSYVLLSRNSSLKEKKRVVHFHNLESHIAHLRSLDGSFFTRWIHRLNHTKLQNHERKLAQLADELWFLSPSDLERYIKNETPKNVRLVPPGFARLPAARRTTTETTIGFIGKLDFLPNAQSVDWILDDLAPELQKLGFKGKLLIAGSGAHDHWTKKSSSFPFIQFTGFQSSMNDFWNSISTLLVPELTQSGVRIKLLESLLHGVPVLTHEISSKMLPPELGNDPLIFFSDDPRAWAKRITENPPVRGEAPNAIRCEKIYQFLSK